MNRRQVRDEIVRRIELGLPTDELEAWAEEVYGWETLDEYILRASPHHPPPRHILPLCHELDNARGGDPLRLLISMPPGHAKTETLLHALGWWTEHNPADFSAYVSYSDTIALAKSRRCRDIVERAGYKPGGSSDSAGEWTTREGGGVISAGIMAGITGRRIQGLLVVDDPFKNREEANSKLIRDKVYENFNEVCMTRLEGGSAIVMHTRWHEDDLIGRLKKQPGWKYINLAAVAEAGDMLGREVGESLWAGNAEYTAQKLAAIKSQIGDWSFAALYQGSPRPKGHNIFGTEHYYQPGESMSGYRVVIYGDPAATKKTTSDYGVMMAAALTGSKENQVMRILGLYRNQMTIPEYVRRLRAFQQQYGDKKVYVEAVGAFKAVPDMLREIDPKIRIEEDYPAGDKFLRAQSVAAAWGEGRVLLPEGAPWVGEFLEEVQAFTGINDSHDDQVDCLSGCWNVGSVVPATYAPRPPGQFHTTRR